MKGPLGILGPGVLGLSTAQWAAEQGLDVRILGRDLDHAQQGRAEVLRRWDRACAKGRMEPNVRDQAQRRLTAHAFERGSVEPLATLLEAVPEMADLKAGVLARAAAWGANDLLLLTGTSALPVSRLAQAAGVSGRL
ncbi:MAG TPA: 3-hydroxyacyl-CoA dehydrogenase NAD-binding domain-containing protein, partial [Holophagaceae bacterium]